MKYIKKFLVIVFCLMVILSPTYVFAATKKKNLVNVYVFEAGGCYYCAEQIKYLESLPSYNKKFKIVEMELYESTSTWAKGKDYKLGVAVAELFNSHGFDQAAYDGTPFMVISDLYAATGLFTGSQLEEIIDKAYKEGDKNVVNCVKKGKKNCLSGESAPVEISTSATTTTTTTTAEGKTEKEKSNNGFVIIIILAVAVIFIIISRRGNSNDDDVDYYDEEDDDDEDDDDEDDDDEDDDDEDDDDEDDDVEDDDEDDDDDDDVDDEDEDDIDDEDEDDDDSNKNKSKRK